jgi:hypothetical protein
MSNPNMSNPNMTYISNNKYDDVTQRFVNNIMKTMADSISTISAAEQPKVTTPASNSSAKANSTAQNPIHGILNAAFNFDGSTATANNLGPIADIIMEGINMLAPQQTAAAKKDKNPEHPTPTTTTSNCSDALKQNNTKQALKCPYAVDSKLYELYNNINTLRAQINELPGGKNYLRKCDEEHNAILHQLLMKNYEKLLVFREIQSTKSSIIAIVQKQNPKAILPENAKKELASYVNASHVCNPIVDVYDAISLTKFELAKLETLITTWLTDNTGMYVVAGGYW